MGYLDSTGTYVKIGTEVAVPSTGGEYRTYGELREIEIKIADLTKLTSTPGGTILNDNLFFPKSVVIQEVEVFVNTAATSGGSATLDLGLIATDRSTEIDFNGILAAAPLADINATGNKKIYTKGVTGIGALDGVANTSVGYLCANYNTAAFTAGAVTIRIRYIRP